MRIGNVTLILTFIGLVCPAFGCGMTKGVIKGNAERVMLLHSPADLLPNLNRLMVEKDFSVLPLIAYDNLFDPPIFYGNSWWFHNHAGTIGISLTAEEIGILGMTDVARMGYLAPDVSAKELAVAKRSGDAKTLEELPSRMIGLDSTKLDKFPESKSDPLGFKAICGTPLERASFNAGIYRLLKGIPDDLWPKMSIIEVAENKGSLQGLDVFIGYNGTWFLQIAIKQQNNGAYGIYYMYYKVHPKTIPSLCKDK